jgi:hypothetical protein
MPAITQNAIVGVWGWAGRQRLRPRFPRMSCAYISFYTFALFCWWRASHFGPIQCHSPSQEMTAASSAFGKRDASDA